MGETSNHQKKKRERTAHRGESTGRGMRKTCRREKVKRKRWGGKIQQHSCSSLIQIQQEGRDPDRGETASMERQTERKERERRRTEADSKQQEAKTERKEQGVGEERKES